MPLHQPITPPTHTRQGPLAIRDVVTETIPGRYPQKSIFVRSQLLDAAETAGASPISTRPSPLRQTGSVAFLDLNRSRSRTRSPARHSESPRRMEYYDNCFERAPSPMTMQRLQMSSYSFEKESSPTARQRGSATGETRSRSRSHHLPTTYAHHPSLSAVGPNPVDLRMSRRTSPQHVSLDVQQVQQARQAETEQNNNDKRDNQYTVLSVSQYQVG